MSGLRKIGARIMGNRRPRTRLVCHVRQGDLWRPNRLVAVYWQM